MRFNTIRAQFNLTAAAVIGIMSLTLILSFFGIVQYTQTVELLAQHYRAQLKAGELSLLIQDLTNDVVSYAAFDNAQRDAYADKLAAFRAASDELLGFALLNQQEIGIIRHILDIFVAHDVASTDLFNAVDRRRATDNATLAELIQVTEGSLLQRVDQLADDLNGLVDELNVSIKTVADDIETNLLASVNRAVWIVLIVLLFTGGTSLIITRRASRRISAPILTLADSAGRFAQGNYHSRAPENATNEVGLLARAFNDMADRIQNLLAAQETRIKEAQQAREQAERSDQVKSAFLASMSHELRTPLNAIINFTKFVAKGDLGEVNEEQRATLNEVIDSGKHLLNLINDVLDMSKIQSGSLNLFVEDNVNLTAILDTVVKTGRGLVAEKPVTIVTEYPADLPKLRGDRQRITQILLNIMSNAAKFTDEGEIVVTAAAENGDVVISIRDTGPGIPLADQADVFKPFKQTDSGLRKGGGTGLGMPISRSLTEAHGGRLWLRSSPGEGATFFVSLPVHSTELTPSLAAKV